MQKTTQFFESPCGKAKLFVENNMSIGVLHDFLMYMKGEMVERMQNAHKQELEEMEKQKNFEEKGE